MYTPALEAYALLIVVLTLKFIWLIGLQGLLRMRAQRFRWPEDAQHWQGQSGSEDQRVERAQAALRNDGESQPLFLAAAALWLALGAERRIALWVCGLYVLLRVVHSVCLVWPRQPLRNRSFGLSLACLVGVLLDCARLLFS